MPRLANPRHEAFCQEYRSYGNAAEAAREVGYDPDHAANQGYRLLRRPEITARIDELNAEEESWVAARRAKHEVLLGRIAHLPATEAEALIVKLDPVYDSLLRQGHYDEVMKVIALQAEIAGHLGPEDESVGRTKRRSRPRRGSSRADDQIVRNSSETRQESSRGDEF
jgi:hypothetical protein